MNKQETNKLYYATHKDEIAKKLYAKEACPCCDRVVSHQNMNKHQKTTYCMSRKIQREDKQLLDKIKSDPKLQHVMYYLINS